MLLSYAGFTCMWSYMNIIKHHVAEKTNWNGQTKHLNQQLIVLWLFTAQIKYMSWCEPTVSKWFFSESSGIAKKIYPFSNRKNTGYRKFKWYLSWLIIRNLLISFTEFGPGTSEQNWFNAEALISRQAVVFLIPINQIKLDSSTSSFTIKPHGTASVQYVSDLIKLQLTPKHKIYNRLKIRTSICVIVVNDW